MEATDAKVLVSAESGLPEEFPEFVLPVDSAKALCRLKGTVVGVAKDAGAVKFFFDNGISLTSGVISGEFPETSQFFDGDWEPLGLEAAAPDLNKIDCDRVHFKSGVVLYVVLDTTGQVTAEGELPAGCNPEINATVSKRMMDHLLANSDDVRVHNAMFQSFSDDCRVIACGMR
jgi:hypothetical protein